MWRQIRVARGHIGGRGPSAGSGDREVRTVEAYGPGPLQRGEWWVPPDAQGPLPTVVLVHGGYWRPAYDRTLEDAVAADLAGRGFLVWVPDYAASDVLYLHRLKGALDRLLEREGRTELAQACFDFLPARAHLDLLGWGDENDIFRH